jgi:hypothetical protein
VTRSASALDDLRRLGLAPGASPDALKPAWRRAVSQLHPDRHGEHADRELAEANAAFQRLQAFVRTHGRLPGPSDATPAVPSSPPRARRRWVVAGLGLAAAAVVLWPQTQPAHVEPTTEGAEYAPSPEATATSAMPIGARPERIALGLDAADVERLAGPPMFRSAERWEYGPSEIRFTDGRVSGWYSSPLRPLPVADIASFPAEGAE